MIESVTRRALNRMARDGRSSVDDGVQASFTRMGTVATAAVARWLAGEPVDAASAAGEEFSRVFAQLAASSDVLLGEVVLRLRYWRDACHLVLRQAAEEHLASQEALTLACDAIQRAVDRALAQTSAMFDAERQRTLAELARRQQELSFLATHDPLTGLANRSLIMDSLRRMLARAVRRGGVVAVLFIDLDDFKLVNDTLGHAVGDRLLLAVADRLRQHVREEDTLGRLGGDEFVVLGECVSAEDGPSEFALRLASAFTEPFSVYEASDPLPIAASVGLAIGHPGNSPEQLLSDADIAMYSEKSRGGGRKSIVAETKHALARHAERWRAGTRFSL